MSNACISNCINDSKIPVKSAYRSLHNWPESDADFINSTAVASDQLRRRRPKVVDSDSMIPVKSTYRNLHKWPESDADFMNSTAVSSDELRRGRPKVVDSISCRQLYLRSYTFTRKETVPERAKKCLDRVKEKVAARRRRKRRGGGRRRRCLGMVVRRVKAVSRSAVRAIFRRLLSCTTSVDVVHH